MGTPSDSFHRGTVGGKLADRSTAFGTPNEQFVIVATWRKQVIVEGPFQPTYLLGVSLVFWDYSVKALPSVPHLNTSVSRTARQNAISPCDRADSSTMASVLTDSTTFSNVPKLNRTFTSANSNLRALTVPIQTWYWIRNQITKLKDSVIVGVPEVKAGIQSNWKYVLRWPLEKIQVEVVLEIRSVKHFEGNLADLSVLWIRTPFLEFSLN